MSGVYLYCVVPAGVAPPPGLEGIEDAPVLATHAEAFSAWYSELAARPEPSLERIRRHNRVVEAALTPEATPVPARFGQWLGSLEALEKKLQEATPAYAEALGRVAGSVEFGLRVLDPATPAPVAESPPAPAATTGRAYLEALAARAAAERAVEERGRELATRVSALIGAVVRQERVERARSRHGIVSLAHLVAWPDVRSYRARVEGAREQHPELRFLLTGPWPPYSFAA